MFAVHFAYNVPAAEKFVLLAFDVSLPLAFIYCVPPPPVDV